MVNPHCFSIVRKRSGVLKSGQLKTAVGFFLPVVKPMGSHSSKLIQSVCQCFRIVVLQVSDRVDLEHMPKSQRF